jgi:hypothetical protein
MKRNLLFIAAIFFFALTFSLSSCKKDDIKTGLSEDIQNLVPDSLLQTIKDLGMPVNEGLVPPDIENIYLASPFELVSSNIAGDTPGHVFADFRVKFSDQNNDDLTVKVSYVNGSEEGNSLGSFVSGYGNDFSVFIKMTSTSLDTEADLLLIISGTKVTEGIKDLYYAIFMLNNYGNVNDYWIDNGKGRVIYDSDGISPIVESLKSLKIDNQLMLSNQSVNSPFIKKIN